MERIRTVVVSNQSINLIICHSQVIFNKTPKQKKVVFFGDDLDVKIGAYLRDSLQEGMMSIFVAEYCKASVLIY